MRVVSRGRTTRRAPGTAPARCGRVRSSPGSPPGVVRSVRAALLALGPRAWSLRVRALEALTDRRDVERQVLERLDGARGEREREVLALPLGAGLAVALRGLGALERTTRGLRPRLVTAPRIAEQLAQHPLRQLEELARVRPVGRHPFPSQLIWSTSRGPGDGRSARSGTAARGCTRPSTAGASRTAAPTTWSTRRDTLSLIS